MNSHAINSERGQQAMERNRLGTHIASTRAAKARKYEQAIADLENTDPLAFSEQLINTLMEQPRTEDAKLQAAWQSGDDLEFMRLLRLSHREHIHLIAEANCE